MRFAEPRYSRKQINQAGEYLKGEDLVPEETIDILDNWRAAHSYPMHVFYVRLKSRAESVDSNALVAQRLKRASSIIAKLKRSYHGRSPSMELYQMQDIAGCRAILTNVALAKQLTTEHYLKSDLKHKLVNMKDYITTPKSDGYRSIHLIYRYRSDKKNKMYNGLLIEVQIRSKLQHLWATAVETVGFFTRQAIKSSEGSPEWTEFFRLVSSAFARMENCPTIPGTPLDEELYSQIAQKETELNVVNKIDQWASALQVSDNRSLTRGAKFFLLELDIDERALRIQPYTKSEEQEALDQYARLEKKYAGNKGFDVVLAGVDTARDLRKAYPNYYVDMREFSQRLKTIIQKAKH